MFLGLRLESPFIALLVFIISYFHSLFTIDGWEVGTIAWPSQDVDVWQCNGDPPTDGSNNWPEKPCPSASARAGASIEQCNGPNVVIPENCDAVILPNFKPQNFRIDLGP